MDKNAPHKGRKSIDGYGKLLYWLLSPQWRESPTLRGGKGGEQNPVVGRNLRRPRSNRYSKPPRRLLLPTSHPGHCQQSLERWRRSLTRGSCPDIHPGSNQPGSTHCQLERGMMVNNKIQVVTKHVGMLVMAPDLIQLGGCKWLENAAVDFRGCPSPRDTGPRAVRIEIPCDLHA